MVTAMIRRSMAVMRGIESQIMVLSLAQPSALVPMLQQSDRPLMSMMVGVSGAGRPVHHAQHRKAAGLEEAPDDTHGENQKNQVQPGRVIPGDGGLDHPRAALRRDEGKAAEDELADQRRGRHGDVERS